MSSIKHIVFLTPGFPKHEEDTTCIPPLQAYLLSFKKTFPEVRLSVVSLHYPGQNNSYLWHGIKVFPLHGERFGKLGKPLLWYMLRKKLKSIHREKAVDFLHSFWLSDTTFFAQSFTQKEDIPHLATIMGQDALASNRYLNLIDFNSLKVVAISPQAAQIFSKNTGQNIQEIIPWGIGPEVVREKNTKAVDKEVDILVVSSFIEIKNYDAILNVVREVKKSLPELKCAFYGEGKLKKKVKEKIKKAGLETNIDLMGQRPRAEVLHAMSNSRLLLHCAKYEGQGYVFLEAMANALPIVTFDVGFLPKHDLVQICHDEKQMIQKINDILTAPADHEPAAPIKIQDTVHEYWKIYHQQT